MSTATPNSVTPHLDQTDPDVAQFVRREGRRQGLSIELIASENFVSEAVLEAVGSVLDPANTDSSHKWRGEIFQIAHRSQPLQNVHVSGCLLSS